MTDALRSAAGWGDAVFRFALMSCALTVPLLFLAIVAQLTHTAWPAIREFGFSFLYRSTWDPARASAAPPR